MVTSITAVSSSTSTQSFCNKVGDLCERIKACLTRFFEWVKDFFCCYIPTRQIEIQSTEETITEEEALRIEETQRSLWQQQMQVPIRPGSIFQPYNINLTSRTEPVNARRCRPVGLTCVPHIGRREGGAYAMSNQRFIAKLPKRQLERFPEAIRNQLKNISEENTSVYFIIYNDSEICDGSRYRNILYHPMVYPDIENGQEADSRHLMGVFGPEHVEQDLREAHRAMPFDRFAEQRVLFHLNPLAMSPDNGRFTIEENTPWSSFYSAAMLPGDRAAAFFGIMIHDENDPDSQALFNAIEQASMEGFKQSVQEGNLDDGLKDKIDGLFTFHSTHIPGAS